MFKPNPASPQLLLINTLFCHEYTLFGHEHLYHAFLPSQNTRQYKLKRRHFSLQLAKEDFQKIRDTTQYYIFDLGI
jgi:hypothetical protein